MNRHNFLKALSTSTIGSVLLSKEAEAQSEKPLAQSGVKITNVKPYIFSSALYVKIETDAGVSGWGEGDHETTSIIGKFVEEVFKPILLGQDPFEK